MPIIIGIAIITVIAIVTITNTITLTIDIAITIVVILVFIQIHHIHVVKGVVAMNTRMIEMQVKLTVEGKVFGTPAWLSIAGNIKP